MMAFLARSKWLTKWLTAGLVGVIVCSVGFEAWAIWMTTAPLDEPISLSPAGTIDRDIRIVSDGPHILQLAFAIGTRRRWEAGVLIGAFEPKVPGHGRLAMSDIDVPMRWSLTNSEGRVAASGEGGTSGCNGYSSTEFFRPVATSLRSSPGQYRFKAAVLRDVTELDGMTARLRFIRPGGKSSFGWQDDVLFWGRMINWLVVWPLVVLFVISLLAISASYRRS